MEMDGEAIVEESKPLLDSAVFGEETEEDGSNAMLIVSKKKQSLKKKTGAAAHSVPPAIEEKKPGVKMKSRKERKLKQLMTKHREKEKAEAIRAELKKYPLPSGLSSLSTSEVKEEEEANDSSSAPLSEEAKRILREAKALSLLAGGGQLLSGVKARRLQRRAVKRAFLENQKLQSSLREETGSALDAPLAKRKRKEESKAEVDVQTADHQDEEKHLSLRGASDNDAPMVSVTDIAITPSTRDKEAFSEEGRTEQTQTPTDILFSSPRKSRPRVKAFVSLPSDDNSAVPATSHRHFSFDSVFAASQLRRPEELRASRESLPAMEAECQVLSFLARQRHFDNRELDAEVSSDTSDAETEGPSQKDRRNLRHADVVCVAGPTGSGKSTQVPQFLFEGGACFSIASIPADAINAQAALIGNESPDTSDSTDAGCARWRDVPVGGSKTVSCKSQIGRMLVLRRQQICVTQPRRVAAVALSRRVGQELGNSKLVGFQIRHAKENVGPECCIKFVTDGVLLREIKEDFLCRKYSVIIVDEAHERSVNIDLLIGLLSRAVALRRQRFEEGQDSLPPLKLLLMSATMREDDFSKNRRLFTPQPSWLRIPSSAFDVQIHFSKTTKSDYVDAAVKKALQIHTRLPAGSVLVFLTGRTEVLEAVRRLQDWQRRRDATAPVPAEAASASEEEEVDFALSDSSSEDEAGWGGSAHVERDTSDAGDRTSKQDSSETRGMDEAETEKDSALQPRAFVDGEDDSASEEDEASTRLERSTLANFLSAASEDPSPEEAEPPKDGTCAVDDNLIKRKSKKHSCGGWRGAGVRRLKRANETAEASGKEEEFFIPRLTAVPLYANLPREAQDVALADPRPSERRVIVATNVAETSLTLPNIRYVVDSGRVKRRIFSPTALSAFSYFTVAMCSQASAKQRSGRAGREGPGVCYRLFSSAVFSYQMQPSETPQVQRMPLDQLLLFMAAVGALSAARRRLVDLGALHADTSMSFGFDDPAVRCTSLGMRLNDIPLPPRFGKMLLVACARAQSAGVELVSLACLLVSALAVGQLLPSHFDRSGAETKSLPEFESDLDAYLWIMGGFCCSEDSSSKRAFCRLYGLPCERLKEAEALSNQVASVLKPLLLKTGSASPETIRKHLDSPLKPSPPNLECKRHLRHCVLQGLIDHIATFEEPPRQTSTGGGNPGGQSSKTAKGGFKCAELSGQLASLSGSSVMIRLRPRPRLIAYNLLLHEGQPLLADCFPVTLEEIASCDSPLIRHQWLQMPKPVYDSKRDCVVGWSRPIYSPLNLTLPAIERPLPRRAPESDKPKTRNQRRQSQCHQSRLTYSCFAAALLQGLVISQLKQYAQLLQRGVVDIAAAGVPHGSACFEVKKFVQELSRKDVASKAELLAVWKSDPDYLYGEFISLLKTMDYETRQRLREQWPPVTD